MMPSRNHYLIQYWKGHGSLMLTAVDGRATFLRVMVIGSSGAGKSTLARQLGQKLNLPVIHLDRHYWHAGWVGTPLHEWRETVRQFSARSHWIMDGNYRSTLAERASAADTVIFLDLPRWLCVMRVIKRRVQHNRQPRPDMAPGCVEKLLDPELPAYLNHIWQYERRARPHVVYWLQQLDPEKRVLWLRTRREIAALIKCPITYAGLTLGRQRLPFSAAI